MVKGTLASFVMAAEFLRDPPAEVEDWSPPSLSGLCTPIALSLVVRIEHLSSLPWQFSV